MDRVDGWFEVPLGGTWETAPWRAAYRVTPRGGRVEVLEVRVFPHLGNPGKAPGEWSPETGVVPKGGMPARLIRDHLTIGTHIHENLPALLNQKRAVPHLKFFFEWLSRLGYPVTVAKGSKVQPGKGPKGRSDEELVALAAIYLEKANVRAPIHATAAEVGLSPTVVRDALHRARNRGLLTKTGQGLPGGELTPRAKSIQKKRTPTERKAANEQGSQVQHDDH